MKNLFILFLFAASIQAYAQESALLRANFNEGENFEVKLIQNTSTGIQGSTEMTIVMDMAVNEVDNEMIKSESKITSISMDVNQGGMSMSYDSNQKEDELDATGKMLKGQLSPMMDAIIYSTTDIYGNTVETTVEPAIPGMEQFTSGQASIQYPKEKVSLGSTWTSENESQGMKINTTYTVTKIADGMVYLDINGEVSGAGTGSMTGKSEIEISTGLAKNTESEIKISAQGTEVVVSSQVMMSKK